MKKTGRQDHWLDRIAVADDAANDGAAFVPNKVVKREKLSARSKTQDDATEGVSVRVSVRDPT